MQQNISNIVKDKYFKYANSAHCLPLRTATSRNPLRLGEISPSYFFWTYFKYTFRLFSHNLDKCTLKKTDTSLGGCIPLTLFFNHRERFFGSRNKTLFLPALTLTWKLCLPLPGAAILQVCFAEFWLGLSFETFLISGHIWSQTLVWSLKLQ